MNISQVNSFVTPKMSKNLKMAAIMTAGVGTTVLAQKALMQDKIHSEAGTNYGKALINIHQAKKKSFNAEEYLTNEHIALMDSPSKNGVEETSSLEKFSAEEELLLMDEESSNKPIEGLKDSQAECCEKELLTEEHIMLMD